MDKEEISEQEKNIMISRGQVVDHHAPKEDKSDYGITRPVYDSETGQHTIDDYDPDVDEKLRVDQIDSQVGRVASVSSVNGTTAVGPVTASTSPVNFADALDQWRSMSEKYRNQRLSRDRSSTNTRYKDSYQPSQQQPNNEEIHDEYIKSVDQDNNQMLLEEQKHQNDLNVINDLVGLVQTKNNQIENNSQPPMQNFKEKINNDITDRILGRLSTANLDIDPDMFDEYEENNDEDIDNGTLKVSDVMTRNVISVIDSMSVEQVASIFNKKNITGVPVVHYKTKLPIGIITMSDILEHVFSDGFASSMPIEGNPVYQQDSLVILDMPVSDIMNTKPLLVTSDSTVQDVCQEMIDNDRHRALVIENNKVRGIFTSFDAVKVLAKYGINK